MSSALAPTALILHEVGVSATRTRRRFPAAFKRQMLANAATCTKPGELGALLRRHGLYSSHLAAWRAAERRGDLARGAPARRRGPVPTPRDPNVQRVAELERQLARATARAERAEALVEVQKKVAALLDQLLPSSDAAPTGRR